MADLTQQSWSADEATWRAAVDKALKGASFERLQSKTLDDCSIEPLYQPSGGAPLTAHSAPWTIVQRVDQTDPAVAQRQALEDLENGAGGLELVFEASPHAWFGGLPLDFDVLDRALDGVELDLIELRINAGPAAAAALQLVHALCRKRGVDLSNIAIKGGADPAALAAYGFSAGEGASVADGRYWHAAGATPAQELALVLASFVDAVRGIAGPSYADVTLVAEPDQFATIAKLRAARLVFSRLAEAMGTLITLDVHAETAWRDLTRHDAHVNILRSTTATFAAAIAGAQSITVLPFSSALGAPDATARRIARNTQSVLQEESHLAIVGDPAAGSGALDQQTEALAASAWGLFQQIEAAGGALEAVRSGLPQGWINQAATERRNQIATRRAPIIGTSVYANLTEQTPRVLASDASAPASSSATLAAERTSARYEDLRTRAAAIGDKAQVYLAPLGALASFSDRAAFARGVYEAGGLSAAVPEAAMTPAEVASDFQASGAPYACLVGADADYEDAADLRARLSAAGASLVMIAAPPKTAPRGFAAEDCIHLKTDVVALLDGLLQNLDP